MTTIKYAYTKGHYRRGIVDLFSSITLIISTALSIRASLTCWQLKRPTRGNKNLPEKKNTIPSTFHRKHGATISLRRVIVRNIGFIFVLPGSERSYYYADDTTVIIVSGFETSRKEIRRNVRPYVRIRLFLSVLLLRNDPFALALPRAKRIEPFKKRRVNDLSKRRPCQ